MITNTTHEIYGDVIPLYHLGTALHGHFICPAKVKDLAGYYLTWLSPGGDLTTIETVFLSPEAAIDAGRDLISRSVAYWTIDVLLEEFGDRGLISQFELGQMERRLGEWRSL